MAKQSNLLWLLLGGGALWYFFRQGARVDVGNPGVSSVKIRNGALNIEIEIPILNRSDLQYKVQGFLGSILYAGNPIGIINMPAPVIIPPRSQANPRFTAVIKWTDLSQPVLQVLQGAGVMQWLGDLVGMDIPGGTPNPNTGLMNWNKFSIRGTLFVDNLKVDINQSLA